MMLFGVVLIGVAMAGQARAQQPVDPFGQNNVALPPNPIFGRPVAPPRAQQNPPNAAQMNGPGVRNPQGLDPASRDPTQAAPDMRRILEGEQEQVRRDPPPPIEVVGKVIGRRGIAKALLRINSRYYLVEKGTRFSLPTSLEPVVYTVSGIDAKGIEIQGGEENLTQRLQ